VPASELLPQRPRRASPYLYSDADIAALIAATSTLRTRLRQATFATLIGLLAVTGIRVGEVIALDRGDVDLTLGWLTVRYGKFGKTRELALHPSSVDALRRYQRLRDRSAPVTDGGVLRFLGRNPAALLQCSPRVPPAGASGRSHATLVVMPAAHPRSAAFICGPVNARRLRRR
jgi:integrase/recombinase XerD